MNGRLLMKSHIKTYEDNNQSKINFITTESSFIHFDSLIIIFARMEFGSTFDSFKYFITSNLKIPNEGLSTHTPPLPPCNYLANCAASVLS